VRLAILLGSNDPWYTRALDSLPRIGELLAALLAAIALAGIVRGIYRRTLGRRRDRYARIRRLGTNGQLSFFTSVLGEPPAMRRRVVGQMTTFDDNGERQVQSRTFIETVYIDRDFYVHAVADQDETVHAFSVTTRSKGFRPPFRPPGALIAERRWPLRKWERTRYRIERNQRITLGKTRFAELQRPDNAAWWVGAHNAHYFETHYLGNPGYYQHFVYSVNDAGFWAFDAPFNAEDPDFSWGFEGDLEDAGLALAEADAAADGAEGGADEAEGQPPVEDVASLEDDQLPENLRLFRRQARVNTYTVIGPALFLDDYPGAEGRIDQYPVIFGANSGRVRTLGRD
jgi:hypothetical protein